MNKQQEQQCYITFEQLNNIVMQIVGLSALATTFVLMAYDGICHLRQKKKNIQQKKAIKICMTGGPCGGKSAGIDCIYNTFKFISAPFFIVPEAATVIGTAGIDLDLSKSTPEQAKMFQLYLMRLQYNLQDIVGNIAENIDNSNKTPVVLCDRGLLDGRAYAGDENFNEILKQVNLTQQQAFDRYQAVLHMVTAAKGADQFYQYNNAVRKQSIQAAAKLDDAIEYSYRNHPKRFLISNDFYVNDFNDKKIILIAQVYQILMHIIKEHNLVEYYKIYNTLRKNSEENNKTAYTDRKKKYRKYIQREGFQKQYYNRKQIMHPNIKA